MQGARVDQSTVALESRRDGGWAGGKARGAMATARGADWQGDSSADGAKSGGAEVARLAGVLGRGLLGSRLLATDTHAVGGAVSIQWRRGAQRGALSRE